MVPSHLLSALKIIELKQSAIHLLFWIPPLQRMHIVAMLFLFRVDQYTYVTAKILLVCNVTELVSQISYVYFIKICVYIVSETLAKAIIFEP